MKKLNASLDQAFASQSDGAQPNPLGRLALGFAPPVLIVFAALWFSGSLFLHSIPKPPPSSQTVDAAKTFGSWGQAQAKAVDAKLRSLDTQLQRDAKDSDVQRALSNPTPGALKQAANALTKPAGTFAVQLLAKGSYLDEKITGDLGYAVRDLLRRAETGQKPGPEAYYQEGDWAVYAVKPVTDPKGEVLGTVLRKLHISALISVPELAPEVGELRLVQRLGDGPMDVLMEKTQHAASFPTGNDRWTLNLGGGPSMVIDPPQAPPPSRGSLLRAALPALFGGLLAALWLYLFVGRDKGRRESSTGDWQDRPQTVAFSLPASAAAPAPSARASTAEPAAPAPPAQRRPTTAPHGESQTPAPAERTKKAAADHKPAGKAGQKEASPPPETEVDSLDLDFSLGVSAPDETPAASTGQAAAPIDFALSEKKAAPAAEPRLSPSIFRAYDIRGINGDTMTLEGARLIGRAIGTQALAVGEKSLTVGRDGRLSSPRLGEALIRGITESGCDVTDIGMVPTPVLYFATNVLDSHSGVMVTGSHNPPEYNGFKIVIAGDTLAGEQIQRLHGRIETGRLASGAGTVEVLDDVVQRYCNDIRGRVSLNKKLKVVVDCGNGVTGTVAPQLLELLGCEVVPLYTEVDGSFPNHLPDPSKPKNLEQLIAKVQQSKADLGIAFDGDGDRIGVVSNAGNIIYPDRLLMLFAKDLVRRNPGAEVIYDIKCSRRVSSLIRGYGGVPLMYKTGHSLIKKKMKESGALLAGEMSGHIFFQERWYGFDDAMYSAARLLEIVGKSLRDVESLFADVPSDFATPEITVEVSEESKFQIVDALIKNGKWKRANLVTLDGLRVEFLRGWGLVRASNTSPNLVLRFEGETPEDLKKIQGIFREQLQAVAPGLSLPF